MVAIAFSAFAARTILTTLQLLSGLTLLGGTAAQVVGNTFIDNSDINLIVGSGANANVAGNSISHQNGASFGGTAIAMLDCNPSFFFET